MTVMAVVAAMMSTITVATTPPMMATVSEAELDGSRSGAAAVCSGGIVFPGLAGAVI